MSLMSRCECERNCRAKLRRFGVRQGLSDRIVDGAMSRVEAAHMERQRMGEVFDNNTLRRGVCSRDDVRELAIAGARQAVGNPVLWFIVKFVVINIIIPQIIEWWFRRED